MKKYIYLIGVIFCVCSCRKADIMVIPNVKVTLNATEFQNGDTLRIENLSLVEAVEGVDLAAVSYFFDGMIFASKSIPPYSAQYPLLNQNIGTHELTISYKFDGKKYKPLTIQNVVSIIVK